MEQFNLEKWLKDQSRKIVTRDGRPVRIFCTDAKAKDGCCIIAAIETDGEEEGYQFYKDGRAYYSKSCIEDCADLFFADEKEELTEFEKAVNQVMWTAYNYDDCSNGRDVDDIFNVKATSKTLLDLARKEILEEFRSREELFYKNGFERGRESILKDFPKWKKATEDKDFDRHVLLLEDNRVVIASCVYKDEYYIELNNLKNLPKEE